MRKILNNDELAIGDWIILETYDDCKHYGYITNKGTYKFTCKIAKILDSKNNPLPINRSEYTLNPQSGDYIIYKDSSINIEEEEKKVLIDLALQTKDENWFKELIG